MRFPGALTLGFLAGAVANPDAITTADLFNSTCSSLSDRTCSGSGNEIAPNALSATECHSWCEAQGKMACTHEPDLVCTGFDSLETIDDQPDRTCIVCPSEPYAGDDKNVRVTGDNPLGRIELAPHSFGKMAEFALAIRCRPNDWVEEEDWGRLFDFAQLNYNGGRNTRMFYMARRDGKMVLHVNRASGSVLQKNDLDPLPVGEWVWVIVTFHRDQGIYKVFYNDDLKYESSPGQIGPATASLNNMLLGQSQVSDDDDTDITFSRVVISDKFLDNASAVRAFIYMNGNNQPGSVVQSYDYTALAQRRRGSPKAGFNEIAHITTKFTTEEVDGVNKQETVRTKLKLNSDLEAIELATTHSKGCTGMYNDSADMIIDLRGTPYQLKGIPDSLVGQPAVITALDGNQFKIEGPFWLYGWRGIMKINCSSRQYCVVSGGGYCAVYGIYNVNNVAPTSGDEGVLNTSIALELVPSFGSDEGLVFNCEGDYYAENQVCKDCIPCGTGAIEAEQCKFTANTVCECQNGMHHDITKTDEYMCIEDWYNHEAAKVGLRCGDFSVDFKQYLSHIGNRLHVDHPTDGAYRFRVRGGASGDGINIALIDKNNAMEAETGNTNENLQGAEIFIGGSSEPVVHMASSLGGEPAAFEDISEAPLIVHNQYTDVYVKVEGSTITVGTSNVSFDDDKQKIYTDEDVLSHTFSELPEINRAVFTFGYGDLECEKIESS